MVYDRARTRRFLFGGASIPASASPPDVEITAGFPIEGSINPADATILRTNV